VQKTKIGNPDKTVRLLFEDEASFGRINKPKCCWCNNKFRPCVPSHHIREYRYAFGAVEPLTGERFFLVMPNCNTNNMSIFLKELSKTYSEDIMILVCDGAAWHKSKNLEISGNIIITHIPPYTPEMNPIEQIWKQIRQMGFGNKIFRTLKAVVDRLCDTINLLTDELVKSITLREWIYSIA
jgi:transposase, ISSpnII